MIQNTKYKILNSRKGFTLIELLVAMFIFVMIMGAMVAVSMAGFRSYGKSKAIKTVTEDVGFAITSITKDVRMGKVEKVVAYANGGLENSLMLTRNSTGIKICYVLAGSTLTLLENTTNCVDGTPKIMVDLTGTDMTFDATSGFYSCPTANDTSVASGFYQCPAGSGVFARRGWAEINLNIASPSMETDSISVQTIVSSRDYGWEEVAP
ncbi:MAG: prepilin-type N-terminal cleavage/methylation domain-containing protein [Candidatus Moranbacteria bacterium]|nr:prepilin-type N-terminal cleavage/methylation domain-containing protein [Candidatus Moranbacteria bacterium]